MVSRLIKLLFLVTWISGCATAAPLRHNMCDEKEVLTFADVYRKSKQPRRTEAENLPVLTLDMPAGYVKPYMPVIRPPRVIKVWVPAHVLRDDRNIMVAGHWSFVMLEGTSWFIEGEVR